MIRAEALQDKLDKAERLQADEGVVMVDSQVSPESRLSAFAEITDEDDRKRAVLRKMAAGEERDG